ncbi:MAG: hypothetical protein HQM16_12145 [Deltaproteobacteria bacterium]|nr:hypothetical protein [Deltaproteobacteria bacterium]
MKNLEELLVNILALDRAFEKFEFIHAYFGPKQYLKEAKKIDPMDAYRFLVQCKKKLNPKSDHIRELFVHDFLSSMIMQVEIFILKKKHHMKTAAEALTGARLIRPFDIDAERHRLMAFLKGINIHSMEEFRKSKDEQVFDNYSKFKTYINNLFDIIAKKIITKYAGSFDIDLKQLFKKSTIRIVKTKPDEPPCYYHYDGNYRGTLGVGFKKKHSKAYLEAFFLHEVMPGHHFYYLIRQHKIDHKQNIDPLFFIDPFYSPENIVNEGLATNGDLILEDLTDNITLAGIKCEKTLHRCFYNMWYAKNIANKPFDKNCISLLKHTFKMPPHEMKARIQYFTRDEKYYAPSYPLGIHYLRKLITQAGAAKLHLFYDQNSVRTLQKTIGV